MADRKRIVVVDDDQDLVGLLTVDLERRGYEVIAITDSRKALELVKTLQFDLLLVDIMMPEISGYNVANAVVSLKTTPPPKIIVMTCLDTRRESGVALLSGVSAMVQKPFTLDDLHRKILDVLEKN